MLRAELNGVGYQAHRGLGREDIFFLRNVFLEDVILQRAAQLLRANALFFSGGDVHGPNDRCGGIDGHAGGYLIERNTVEEDLHVSQR